MDYIIHAAVGCHKGKIRRNNEDNLYFDGKILPEMHNGLNHPMRKKVPADQNPVFCIFDGMGGEDCGERASYLAASTLSDTIRDTEGYLLNPREFLIAACDRMNEEVFAVSMQLEEGRMGTTVSCLYFTSDEVYACNLGDTKAYRLRDDVLFQLTKDHVEYQSPNAKSKPRLTQFLGIDPEELTLVPYIAKGELQKGDIYLICSDGLTDMVTNIEICAILKESISLKKCVEKLIDLANKNGGRDNITIILCRVE